MTKLEVLNVVPVTSRLYWIGLYEGSNKWKWFFQVDLASAIGYCAMRMVGGGKHAYKFLSPCGASIDMNERICSRVAAIPLRLLFRLYLAGLAVVLHGWQSTFLRVPACPSQCGARACHWYCFLCGRSLARIPSTCMRNRPYGRLLFDLLS